MKRILVIGCPGAGKSHFAKALKAKTELPLYHLDMLWHKPDKTNISREEFDFRLSEILKEEQWIIDGNYARTLEMRLKECDTVFLLDYPLEVCLQGVEGRIGKKRDDMPWLESEFDEEFRDFIIDFPKSTLPRIYELLDLYKSRRIIIFKSRGEAKEYLDSIL